MNNTGNQEINPITRLDYPDPDVIREFPIVKDTTPNITNSRLNNIP